MRFADCEFADDSGLRFGSVPATLFSVFMKRLIRATVFNVLGVVPVDR